jgi:hypothetical protein
MCLPDAHADTASAAGIRSVDGRGIQPTCWPVITNGSGGTASFTLVAGLYGYYSDGTPYTMPSVTITVF